MNVQILYSMAFVLFHAAFLNEAVHLDAEFMNKYASPEHSPLFIAQGAGMEEGKGLAASDRQALARKGFDIPTENILSITMNGKNAKPDPEKKTEAGSYKQIRGPWEKYEFKYDALEGKAYRENLAYGIRDNVWNKYETLNEHWKDHENYGPNWPEPTLDEKIAGKYAADRTDCNKKCPGHTIYYRSSYFIPSLQDSKTGATKYNGMIIVSAHGNLAGSVIVDGKAMSAKSFGKQIMEYLTEKRTKHGEENLPWPKWIVILACGVGQERTFQEELAEQTQAIVFGSKFVISRTGSSPQMEFEYDTLGASTAWSLANEIYDPMGDSLPKGAQLCQKLRMEFQPGDQRKWQNEKDVGANKNIELMDSDQYYFTMAAPNEAEFDEKECVKAFPKQNTCEITYTQNCCTERKKHRDDDMLKEKCCENNAVKENDDFCVNACGSKDFWPMICRKSD